MKVVRATSLASLIAVLAVAHHEGTGPESIVPRRQGADGEAASRAGSFMARLAAREYWVTESAAGLQAPNRRHGLRTFFSDEGSGSSSARAVSRVSS